jgi:chitinase
MIWELAGDYAFNTTRNEYFFGSTLTNFIYDKFRTAPAYGAKKANITMPAQTLNVGISIGGFALGDNNYPINPELRVTNNTGSGIPAGAQLEFDYPTSAPSGMGQQSGWAMTSVSIGHTGHNRGGLQGDFHRVRLNIPSAITNGAFAEVTLNYVLPISGPSNFTLSFGGQTYALAADHARGGIPPASPTGSTTANPTGPACTAPAYVHGNVYTGGMTVSHGGRQWRAKWWTQNEAPSTGGSGVWEDLGPCGGGTTTPPVTTPPATTPPGTTPPATTPPATTPPVTTPPATTPPATTSPGQFPAWVPNKAYAVGDRVSYGGRNYQCRQAHTSLTGWEPPNVLALWLPI